MSKLDKFIDANKMYSNEGARGFSNLCRIARAVGYRDPFNQGSLSNGGQSGDLMVFFEDNPGAIEAVIDWIRDNEQLYDEALSEVVEDEDDEDEEDDE